MPNNKRNGPRTRVSTRIAIGGVFTALAMVLLLAGNFLPFAQYMAPLLAGLCLLPVALEIGKKTALLCYVAVSAIGVFTLPDMEMVFMFVFLFGYYPVLRLLIGKLRSRLFRVAVKQLVFMAGVACAYVLLLFVFVMPGLREELLHNGVWMLVLICVVANGAFYLYDIMIEKLMIVYYQRLRRYIFR